MNCVKIILTSFIKFNFKVVANDDIDLENLQNYWLNILNIFGESIALSYNN